nr:hypothetical protein [Microbacterium lemovicicum]
MSAIKPVIRELKDAVLKGMAHSKDKLHQVTDNVNTHLDDVVRQVRAQDTFTDRPDMPSGGSGGPTGHRPGDGHVDGNAPTPRPFPELPDPQAQDPDLVDWDLVNAIDTRTGPNDATFWSGRILDADGNPITDGTQLGAQNLTNSTHGETLEQLLDRQGMTDRMPSDWNEPSTGATWREVSTQLAQNASGDVRAYVGDVRAQSVWNECEFPTLAQNGGISSVTMIDAQTGRIVDVFVR